MSMRVVALALLLATPLRAQSGSATGLMTEAVRAYRDLDFDAAARMLQRVLTPPLSIIAAGKTPRSPCSSSSLFWPRVSAPIP